MMLGLLLGGFARIPLAAALAAFDVLELDRKRGRLERRLFGHLVASHDLDELVSVEEEPMRHWLFRRRGEETARELGDDLLGKLWLVRFRAAEGRESVLRLTRLRAGTQAIADALRERLREKPAGTRRASRTP
jgi:hypothetical protein